MLVVYLSFNFFYGEVFNMIFFLIVVDNFYWMFVCGSIVLYVYKVFYRKCDLNNSVCDMFLWEKNFLDYIGGGWRFWLFVLVEVGRYDYKLYGLCNYFIEVRIGFGWWNGCSYGSCIVGVLK